MADKFLYNNAGAITEKTPVLVSAGIVDAGRIPATDATGRLDPTLMPVGVAPETDSLVTTDNLADGDFVNIYAVGGVAKCRKADASVAGKEANGFVLAVYTIGQTAVIYRPSQTNTHRTGMSPGAKQYLSVTVPGGTQETVPTVGGQVIQQLGIADDATTLPFAPRDPIVLA